MKYFDIVFIRTYKQYTKWKEADIPGTYALLVLSTFQSFNLFAVVILVKGLMYGRNWDISKIELTIFSFLFLLFNYIRIHKVVGVKKMFSKYEGDLNLKMHPVVYFVLSVLALIILRLIGFFPHVA